MGHVQNHSSSVN